jgi:adenosylcobinamide kinase / adenosylcobinamide-phosphate guanylyltransferase
MTLIVILGGARSGKSRLAVSIAAAATAPVVFLATGEAGDDEMRERIERHQAERPPGWRTVEEPLALERTLGEIDSGDSVIVDCLSLWVANLLEREDGGAGVVARAARAAEIAARRDGLTVAVSNEVGLGVVPATPLGRGFRDVLGEVNRVWVEAADDAALVVAGKVVPLLDVPPAWRAHV